MTDPRELERIRQEEFNITSRRIQMLIDAGANVILCTKAGRLLRTSTQSTLNNLLLLLLLLLHLLLCASV